MLGYTYTYGGVCICVHMYILEYCVMGRKLKPAVYFSR
jgi:hypothetical protein